MSLQYVSQRALVFVPLPLSWPNKAFPTAATPVSVVVCVEGYNMPLHGRTIREPGRTEGAAVWSLSRVRSEVLCELLP